MMRFQSTPPVKAATIVRTSFVSCVSAFQSTPPVKAATASLFSRSIKQAISIHAAREGGDTVTSCSSPSYDISIHAAREGGDHHTPAFKRLIILFQSTPPVKAATLICVRLIHKLNHFNPRRP